MANETLTHLLPFELILPDATRGPGGTIRCDLTGNAPGGAGEFATLTVSGAATVDSLEATQGVTINAGPLTVGAIDGVGGIVSFNSGTINMDGADVAINGNVTVIGTTFDLTGLTTLRLPVASPYNTYPLTAHVKSIVSASAVVAYVRIGGSGAGTLSQFDVVADATIAAGNLTVTASKVGGAAMTSNVATLTTGTTAGTGASASPATNNTVSPGDVLAFTCGGGNTAAGTATVTATITRATP